MSDYEEIIRIITFRTIIFFSIIKIVSILKATFFLFKGELCDLDIYSVVFMSCIWLTFLKIGHRIIRDSRQYTTIHSNLIMTNKYATVTSKSQDLEKLD